MSCRTYSSHRSHLPMRLGEPSGPIDHGGRCCCVKQDVPCDTTPSERRSIASPQYCRCGALRPPSLDHLFIPEDLSLVPSHLKFSKDMFRGVRVDGRMYFLPNRDQSIRKESVMSARETVIERPSPDFVSPSSGVPSSKDIFKDRHSRLPVRSSPDDWRSERRRPSLGRLSDDRRPKSRQLVTGGDRGSFVLTVNTGSRYQPPPGSRERRFTIPRTGGTTYCSSHSRGSARAAASSSAGSVSSNGGRDSSAETASRAEKRRVERRPRIVKFADDEHLLASIDEEDSPDVEADEKHRSSSESGSKTRTKTKDASKDSSALSAAKEANGKRKSVSRKGKTGLRKSSNESNCSTSADEETKPMEPSEENKNVVALTDDAAIEHKPAKSTSTESTNSTEDSSVNTEGPTKDEPAKKSVELISDGKRSASGGDIALETKDLVAKMSTVPIKPLTLDGKMAVPPQEMATAPSKVPQKTHDVETISQKSTAEPNVVESMVLKPATVIPSLEIMAQEVLTKLTDGAGDEKAAVLTEGKQ